MTTLSKTVLGMTWLVAALLGSGCSGNNTTAPATTTTTTTTSPATEIFTSIVSPQGTATHSFSAATAGTISVTLTTAGPPPTIVMGLGLGVPNPATSGCSLTTSVNTAAGSTPQITRAADAGMYCIAILDLGHAPPTGVSFSITIVHP